MKKKKQNKIPNPNSKLPSFEASDVSQSDKVSKNEVPNLNLKDVE